MVFEYTVEDEAGTLAFAKNLGSLLECSGVVYLKGDLAAGKTTFSRGILRSYGYEGAVKSPTFTIVEPYDLQFGQVYHFDLYRIAQPEELEYLGVDDYLEGGHLCLVEWPERGDGFLPNADIVVELAPRGRGRHIKLTGCSARGNRICEQMINTLGGTKQGED
ncbi:MAG: tRNA threonylcarbamoyladenosine biosynthesis protein TsaE [Candidatus Azotimanducaceae bacterium]|jgi:tRNA threonylcarbamoyladenosine biosynthesis protein TsaE